MVASLWWNTPGEEGGQLLGGLVGWLVLVKVTRIHVVIPPPVSFLAWSLPVLCLKRLVLLVLVSL